MSDPDYDYGPPVTVIGDTGEAAETTGDNVLIPGESPHDPPADADTIYVPGGSPTDEVIAANDPNVGGLSPSTAVIGADATVTVSGTNFRDNSEVEAGGAAVATTYVSDTELTAVLPDPGAAGDVDVTVRNPTSDLESNSVAFTWTASEA